MVDVLGDGISYIKLEKVCADDLDVVNGARISFANHKEVLDESDEKLIKWLMKNDHSSPFSHTHFKFKVKAPIYVARQWFKHTVFHGYNEVSLRYTQAKPEFYLPKTYRKRVGKPGNYKYEEVQDEYANAVYCDAVSHSYEESWKAYKALIDNGVAQEQARIVLPMATYTEFVWTCNSLSLMNFIKLRSHETAQQEIRVYSDQAYKSLEKHMPVTAKAFLETLDEGYKIG